MRDPFRPSSNAQLIREAQIGLSLVAILLILFVYVAFYRINGYGRTIPEHVRNAPVAESVWPNSKSEPDRLAKSSESPSFRVGQFLADQFSVTREPQTARNKKGDDEPVDRALQTDPGHSVPELAVDQPSQRLPSPTKRNTIRHSNFEEPLEPASDQSFAPVVNTEKDIAASEPVRPLINTRIEDVTTHPHEDVAKTFSKTVSPPSRNEQSPPAADISSNERIPARENNMFQPEFPVSAADQLQKLPVEDESFGDFESAAKPNLGTVEPRLESPRPIRTNELRESDIAAQSPKNFAGNSNIGSRSELNLESKPLNTFTSRPIEANKVEDLPSVTTNVRSKPTENGLQVVEPASSIDEAEQQANPIQESPFHLVRAGESFWTIAQLHYDDGRYFRALYKHNEMLVTDFDHLIPGTQLETPSVQDLAQRWPELCPKPDSLVGDDEQEKNLRPAESANNEISPAAVSTDSKSIEADNKWPASPVATDKFYETQTGDTLFGIAAQKLGQASRYLELMQLNETRLPVGVGHLSPLPGNIRLIMP